MPRGGHRGLLFPISGVFLNVFGRRRKRGLYHHCTNELFKPRWGPVKQPSILNDMNLLKWNNGTITSSEMLPSKNMYNRDARSSWPVPRESFISSMYYKNEQRHFKPVMANTEYIKSYLYNVLDSRNIQKNGLICNDLDTKHTISSQHISRIVNLENDNSTPKINLEIPRTHFRFKKLENLIKESDFWKTVCFDHKSSINPFPHVNEGASLIMNLPIHEILHTRSNHRLNRRAHPKWYVAKYRKFMKKKLLKEKLRQLHLESTNDQHI